MGERKDRWSQWGRALSLCFPRLVSSQSDPALMRSWDCPPEQLIKSTASDVGNPFQTKGASELSSTEEQA